MNDIEKNENTELNVEQAEAGKEELKPKKTGSRTDEIKQANKKKLEEDLAAAIAERDEFKDKYLRTLAEFNNFKKRTSGTRSEALKDGQCVAVEQILPVLDNLERALEHIEPEQDSPMAQGFAMVHKLLAEAILKLGVEEIPAMGEAFDPTKHQAIQMAEAKDGETPGNVCGVVQKGYMADDRVIRHSMVIVNK